MNKFVHVLRPRVWVGNHRGKFNNTKVVAEDGTKLDSKREAKRYVELLELKKLGVIRDLVAHPMPMLKMEVNGQLVCRYAPDFTYVVVANGETITEDVKGFKTPVYKLKKKLVKACLGIEIREV